MTEPLSLFSVPRAQREPHWNVTVLDPAEWVTRLDVIGCEPYLTCFIHERAHPGSQRAPDGSSGLVLGATSRFRRVDGTGKAVWPIEALVPTRRGPLPVRPIPRVMRRTGFPDS